jgi:hypothetical protein
MAAIFSFIAEGTPQVQQGLVALLEKTKNLTPFWKTVFAPKYFKMVQDLFATGGRARGGGGRFKSGAWSGLSPKYRIWKNAHYPGRPILVRDGTLRDSLRWTGNGLGPGGIFQATPSYVVTGTAVPHARFHKDGTTNMPARDFLPPPDPEVFAPLLQAWLLKKKGK